MEGSVMAAPSDLGEAGGRVSSLLSALADAWARVERDGCTYDWRGDTQRFWHTTARDLEGSPLDSLFAADELARLPNLVETHDSRARASTARRVSLHATRDGHPGVPVDLAFFEPRGPGDSWLLALSARHAAPPKQDAATNLAHDLAAYTGAAFFQKLVASLQEAFDADYVSVEEFVERGEARVRTLATWGSASPPSGEERPLQGTAAESIGASSEACLWPSDVHMRFPADATLAAVGARALAGIALTSTNQERLGLLLLAFREPNPHIAQVVPLMRACALRAAAELERLRAQESAERAAALVEASINEIYLVDAETILFSEVNRSARENLGYTLRELRGMTPLALRGEADRPTLAGVFEPLMDGSRVRLSFSTEHQRKDGTTYPIALTIQRLTIAGRQYYLGIGQDTSERRALEEQLLHAQKMEAVGRLAGGVAHDFNNALTAILGSAELARMELPPSSPALASIDAVIDAGESAADMTRQLLTFARKQIIKPVVLDPAARLVAIERLLRPVLGEDIRIEVHIESKGALIRIDPGQLEQLLMNLAVNARDAMSLGGKLTLECAAVQLSQDYASNHEGVGPGSYVLIAVSDTGTGMDAETRQRIFEPFFTTKDSGRGTGLGLATCHGIVKQSGGHIWVYSEPGHGSTFKVYLPVVHEQVESTNTEEVEPESGRGTEHILVVEDDERVRKMCALALSGLGYTVTTAANGEAAIAQAEWVETPIDLLLTDVVLPDMRGPDIAKRIAETQPGCLVLYTSGYTENSVVHDGVLDRGVHFLPKPYTPSKLARTLRALLDGRRRP